MAINIDDLRRLAKRRLPRAVFDFADGGAEDERTLRANRLDFSKLVFRPRVLVDVSKRDQSTTILGQPVASPLIVAPTGLAGMLWPRGEAVAARAAANRDVIFTLSTLGACSIEEVAAGLVRAALVPALRDEGPRRHPHAGGAGAARPATRRSA